MSKLEFDYEGAVEREAKKHAGRIKTIEQAKKLAGEISKLMVFDGWGVEVCGIFSATIKLLKSGLVSMSEFRAVVSMAEKATGEKALVKNSYSSGVITKAFADIYHDSFTLDVQAGVDPSSCKIITKTTTTTESLLSPECFDPSGL